MKREKEKKKQDHHLSGEFPGGLVVRIPGFHCHGPGSVTGRGTETLQALWYNNNNKKYIYTQDLSVTLNHNRKDKQLFKKQQQQQQKLHGSNHPKAKSKDKL